MFRLFFNQSQSIVEGLDFEVAYRMEPNFFDSQFESFSIRALAGTLLTREDISANGTVSNRLDTYTLPETTGNITANYSVGPWSVQLQGRHIAGDKRDRRWVEGVDVDDNSVSSSTWFNGTLRYSSEMSNGSTWNVGLSVLNLFDKEPPIVAGSLGNQGINNQYDAYQRRFNLSLNLDF